MKRNFRDFRMKRLAIRGIGLIYSLVLASSVASFLFVSSCSAENSPVKDTLPSARAQVYYLNSQTGNDGNSGLTPDSAWKTLARANQLDFAPGDSLLLCKGSTFRGELNVTGGGYGGQPVVISSYGKPGNSGLPVIDASGYLSAIHVQNGNGIEISNLELVNNGGQIRETGAGARRFGVWVTANSPGTFGHIRLSHLFIHHIFSTTTPKPSFEKGMGIAIAMLDQTSFIKDVLIENCRIEKTGHTGIHLSGQGTYPAIQYLDSVQILNNSLTSIGGPGMVPNRCSNVLVRGNRVDYSGASVDPRMRARGSGIWPWSSHNVLIEKNHFMHARGIGDSCGAHIDFNCSNVTVQYNMSIDNEGGFVEILGNDHHGVYRYNISVNDGSRVKGVNGAVQEGKILWTSGYTGKKRPRTGPFDSYIYNNTVYVKPGSRACFSFAPTTDGLLVANNIFYIGGEMVDVSGDQSSAVQGGNLDSSQVVFTNNLYLTIPLQPDDLSAFDSAPLQGNPEFSNPGGLTAADYVPQNTSLIKNRGIVIKNIPGDNDGVWPSMQVNTDILGRSVSGEPDLGAIEIQ